MPITTIGAGRVLVPGHYHERVLATRPIAYWPLWESAGTVAQCLTNPAMNGVYARDVSVMGTTAGIGDGNKAPLFNGTSDYINAFTATLAAAFNGAAGTFLHWVKVANAGVWTDGTRRDSAFFSAGANDFIFTGRGVGNNLMRFYYSAGAVIDFVNPSGLTTTGWVLCGLTWNKAAEELRVYWDGVQSGATQVALGVWGAPLVDLAIGATSIVPANCWSGGIAHAGLWTRTLPPAEIASLKAVM